MELKSQQEPLEVQGQIDNLKSIGLAVPDEGYARNFLNDVSYFRIVKAYCLDLKEKNGKFKKGVAFNDIVSLYLFNANFRQLIFPQIEKIEINLRCRIANYFSITYGVLGYESATNFYNPVYHQEFLDEIQEEIKRNSKAPFVKNFRNNYVDGKIPFYALIELFSFGLLSKFYKNMKNQDKKAIAKTFGVGYTYLESWIESIATVRNICAHYGRIYNFSLTKTPILYKQYTEMGVSNLRIYGILICLKHLLPNNRHWTEFVETIDLLFEKYPNVRKEYMGFPENWKDILMERA